MPVEQQIYVAFKNIIQHCIDLSITELSVDLLSVDKHILKYNIEHMIKHLFKNTNIKITLYTGQLKQDSRKLSDVEKDNII